MAAWLLVIILYNNYELTSIQETLQNIVAQEKNKDF